MTTKFAHPKHLGLRFCAWLAVFTLAATALVAQKPAARIQSEISSGYTTPIKAAQHPWVQPQFDAGRMPGGTKLTAMTLVFNRTPEQQAALGALLAAQQNPASPQYHQWLTPEQFGARFGMAQSDIDKVQTWLEQQGFTIDSVARSKTFIQFSGSVAQFEIAFQTQMHYYQAQGNRHFAPSSQLAVPSAFAGTVETIRGVSDFKPHSFHVPASAAQHAKHSYTFYGSNNTQYVLFAPGDIKKVYDIPGSVDGTGQTIAVMGQSEVTLTDIENFQSAAGLTVKDPTLVFVPNSGTPAFVSGDEGESDLDLEWSGAIAPGANIDLVYTGNSTNSNGVFDSVVFAVDEKIGNIITLSYGACELELGGFSLDTTLQQANAQGQTVISSSGDSGSTACFGNTNLTTAQQQSLAVNYPASSPYVTGVGGTEITSANDQVGTYWSSAPSTSTVALTSAIKYIPEIAWNDDAASGAVSASQGGGLSATGGGISTLYTTQPGYQSSYFTATHETNPGSGKRLVPDVALYASPEYPGYLYCTSDQSDWASGQTGSCGNSQFYDGSSGYFTVAGGTSFGAPIFAGMVALLNENGKYTEGQGQLNTELYSLASNSATYAAAFHDVTSGNNDCTAGTAFGYCPNGGATLGFSAGTGYDLVTGLGSFDLSVLATAWPTNTASAGTLTSTTTVLSATSTSPNAGASDTVTITVASVPSGSTPTGNVTLSIDGGTTYNSAGTSQSLTLGSSGTVTYSASFTAAGVHTLVAQYAGDATHAPSTGSIDLTVGSTSSGKGSITLAATAVTVSQGSAGASTVTVTPAGGYTGTVGFQVSTSSSVLGTYGCYSATNAVVTGASAATASITVQTLTSQCTTAGVKGAMRRFNYTGKQHATTTPSRSNPFPAIPVSLAAIFGFLMIGSRRGRSKWLNIVGCALLLGALSAVVGCGGGSSGGGSTSQEVPKGTYTLTVTGTDSTTSSITASTTFTLTVN